MPTVNWSRNLDLDLALIEVRDCIDAHWTLRSLCGASVGVDPHDALVAARDLSETVNALMAGEATAKLRLASILGDHGNDYQRCLWYAVAGRSPLGAAVDLHELLQLLERRAALAREAARLGTGVTLADNVTLSR
jgi:hypothetical protein